MASQTRLQPVKNTDPCFHQLLLTKLIDTSSITQPKTNKSIMK